VRVTGPFTVESLSPAPVAGVRRWPDEADGPPNRSRLPATQQPDFTQRRSSTTWRRPASRTAKRGTHRARVDRALRRHAVHPGRRHPAGHAKPRRRHRRRQRDASKTARCGSVGIALGPQYGTVSQPVREARSRRRSQAGDIDLLCVLGLRIRRPTSEVTEVDGATVETDLDDQGSPGRRRAQVRQGAGAARADERDLLMGEELKKTGAGNLFTVFGEPDIEITRGR
jgi:adenine-specific DNA-methyltransferase